MTWCYFKLTHILVVLRPKNHTKSLAASFKPQWTGIAFIGFHHPGQESAQTFYVTRSNEYCGVAFKKDSDDWSMTTQDTAKSIFGASLNLYCTGTEKREAELPPPWNHEHLEALVTKNSTLAKAILPETSHSQEYSTEHNQKHSFNFIFFRSLEERSGICIIKDKNVSIAPKTSVQAQLYHIYSRDKPCLTTDNMTVWEMGISLLEARMNSLMLW